MPYEKTIWQTKDVVTTSRMNHIEEGIKNTEDMVSNSFRLPEVNTDNFYWRSQVRVNSTNGKYATSQTIYAGIYQDSNRTLLYVYPGSTIMAQDGYTMDYSIRSAPDDDSRLEYQRDIAANTIITIEHAGYLRLSVTDGASVTNTDELATKLAKKGLKLNIITDSTLQDVVQKNRTDIAELKTAIDAYKVNSKTGNTKLSDLVAAQKAIAEDWRLAFINVSGNLGLGSNHIIPGTATTWNSENTKDLDQKGVWMRDGVHPHLGTGVRAMYAQTIAPQLGMIAPDYRNDVGLTSPSVWAGRNILWMGTSIPAGRDPNTQNDDRDPYPKLVATMLGATCYNAAEGSSCVRINASTGEYTGMKFVHFLRSLTRTIGECDDIIQHWDNYKSYYSAHETLTEDEKEALATNSFENKLVPWLNGLDPNKPMPDLFVIDHGHNDTNPRGVDGLSDLWIEPTLDMIESGILAEDTYMVTNDYAHLKTALNNDLSGITDKAAFAASLNRNCFKGAMNFLITLILSYNPYARIVIISDYN